MLLLSMDWRVYLVNRSAGPRKPVASPSRRSAKSFPSKATSHLAPVMALTVPEIRRLLNRVIWPQEPAPEHVDSLNCGIVLMSIRSFEQISPLKDPCDETCPDSPTHLGRYTGLSQ
jgi:hypothetical protein